MINIPESHRDLLENETRAFAFLATLMEDGSPQVTPVWFNTDDEHILINSTEDRVKTKNMRARKRVALAIIDPSNPYRYLQVRGRVVKITHERAQEHIDTLAQIYIGEEKFTGAPPNQVRVKFYIKPERASGN